jgi:hypothetical protein
VAMRKPPYQPGQQQPSEVFWRLMPRALHAIPLRGAGPRPPRRGGPRGEWRLAA